MVGRRDDWSSTDSGSEGFGRGDTTVEEEAEDKFERLDSQRCLII